MCHRWSQPELPAHWHLCRCHVWPAVPSYPSSLAGLPADEFLGVWEVDSVLTLVELPLGPEFVPDMRVCAAARFVLLYRCWNCGDAGGVRRRSMAGHGGGRTCCAGGAAGAAGGLECAGAVPGRLPAGTSSIPQSRVHPALLPARLRQPPQSRSPPRRLLQNGRGEVVPNRRFNTASLMRTYAGTAAAEIEWDPDDPNQLQLQMPGGLQVGHSWLVPLPVSACGLGHRQHHPAPHPAVPTVAPSHCRTHAVGARAARCPPG